MLTKLSRPLRRASRSPVHELCTVTVVPNNSEPIEYEGFGFIVHNQQNGSSGKARRCTITTPHGLIETPAFVFCATKAAVKGGVTPDMLKAEGTTFILSNTYHLMLQPGADVVQKLGGLQKMTGWGGPMLTDSGGYQIFSMGHGSVSCEVKGKRGANGSTGWNETLLKIDEAGAVFRSYIDGSVHSLTPEVSMQVQQKLGADLMVVLDECTPFHVQKEYTAASMRRSHRWALRSMREFRRLGCASPGPPATAGGEARRAQALYGIVQGGVFQDLRQESAAFVNSYPFFGSAIGGSLGPDKAAMYDIMSFTRPLLRDDRPVHLLGIGGVRDIFHGVRLGIDTFDCVHPTRLARHGGALVPAAHWDRLREEVEARTLREQQQEQEQQEQEQHQQEQQGPDNSDSAVASPAKKLTHKERKQQSWARLKLKQQRIQRRTELVVREHVNVSKSVFEGDPRPLDPACGCYTCRSFSRGYLHHLFRSKESLGPVLLTAHNVHFMNKLMSDIREGIAADCLDEVQRRYIHPELGAADDTTSI